MQQSPNRIFVEASTRGGRGLFTRDELGAGEVVCEFRLVREVASRLDVEDDPDASPDHCTFVDGKIYLVAAPERYVNHSCDPNVYTAFRGEQVSLVALREIAAGEELTTDYLINNEGGDSWTCGCGASRCRGKTGVSFFSLPLAFQEEYAPLLAPWFLRRNADKLGNLPQRVIEGRSVIR